MKILYIDVETTGTDPKRNGLIQLGQIIEVGGQVVSENSWNIQPFSSDVIEPKALEITKTTREDLFDDFKRLTPEAAWDHIRQTWDQVVNKFDKADKFVLAGYNVDAFDQQFLREFVRRCTPHSRYSIAGSYIGHLTMDPLPYLKWLKALGMIDPDNLKLETVCDYFGIILNEAHDALEDVRATRWLIHRVRRDLDQYRSFQTIMRQLIDEGVAGGFVDRLFDPMDDEPRPVEYAKPNSTCGRDLVSTPMMKVTDVEEVKSETPGDDQEKGKE